MMLYKRIEHKMSTELRIYDEEKESQKIKNHARASQKPM